jgi:hypothetical protein
MLRWTDRTLPWPASQRRAAWSLGLVHLVFGYRLDTHLILGRDPACQELGHLLCIHRANKSTRVTRVTDPTTEATCVVAAPANIINAQCLRSSQSICCTCNLTYALAVPAALQA